MRMQFLTSYFSQTVTDGHFSLAVTILTTMIIGGCLIILVENQHVKGEITSRYHNIMRPFYHKLALYAKFAQQCMFALEAVDNEGKRYKQILQDKTKELSRLAADAIISGKDTPYLKPKELNDICENINVLWYIFDRNPEMYSHLRFSNRILIDEVRSALVAYDRNLSKEKIDLYIFPKVSGNFYVKEWQPIDNIPYSYQFFEQKNDSCNQWLCGSFAIEICSLILIYLSDSFEEVWLFSVDFLVLLSIASFIVAIYKHFKLNKSLYILNF